MLTRNRLIFALLVIVALLTAACQAATAPEPTAPAQIANPASTYCLEQGGRLDMRTDAAGNQTGFCILPDGTECEEWAYFRGECGPAAGSATGVYLDAIEAQVLESFPVQVNVVVRGNLADGCTSLTGIDVERTAERFTLTPRAQVRTGMMCTMALVPFEQVVPLDVAGLKAGVYTVVALDQTTTFALSADN